MKVTHVYRQARDAGNGRWVSLKFAAAHAKTTVIETVRR